MNHHYNMNGLQAHNMAQPHLNGLSQRREGQHDGQSLPPLSGVASPYPPYSVGMPHHPSTSTSSYPSSTQPQYGSTLPQLAPQQSHGMQMGGYSQPGGYANMTQSMMPPASTSMASNLPPATGTRLPDLHPRPQDGSTLLQQLQQQNMHNPMLAPSGNPSEPEPTHVVGQQGRRGILPSAPGRAPGSVRSTVPVKDADGKYPCPHCNKTYQHAKHLKRHLLRHTGDRPYMCKLCKDTFSRSDILKRHFQKCSVRRGVVGDMDHLEGSRAHLQKNRQSADASQNIQFLNPSSVNQSPVYEGSNGMPQMAQSLMQQQQQQYGDMQSNSARNSRSNSLVRPTNAFLDNRRSMSTLEQMGTTRPGDFQSYSAFSNPGGLPSMLPNGTHTGNSSATHSPVGNMPNGLSNGHGYGGFGPPDSFQQQVQKADDENPQIGKQGWNTASRSLPQSNATLDWVKSQRAHDTNEQQRSNAASINTSNDSTFNGLYTDSVGFRQHQDHGHWNTGTVLEDKISSLIVFCIAYTSNDSLQRRQHDSMLRTLLSTANVQDFLSEYKNFHGHWPMLHMPTFNPTQASDSLLLAILCIGATYSDQIDLPQTRWLMEMAKHAVHSSSRILAVMNDPTSNQDLSGPDSTEEIQALLLLSALFLWHGTSGQRARARDEWPQFATLARRCQLLRPMSHSSSASGQPSFLHQVRDSPPQAQSTWDWSTWLEQEKRSKAFYILYLLDCAMAIYFNASPQLDPAELKLRLPADDAAWEAPTSEECAKRLGLYGLDAQEELNTSGSRMSSQPEFETSLYTLFDSTVPQKARETNAYSKFILVHAIHATLWTLQRRGSPTPSVASLHGLRYVTSATSTPDWHSVGGSGPNSTANSGTTTPDHFSAVSFSYSRFGLRGIKGALDRWKRSWDVDNDLQYSPLATNSAQELERQPRTGFCRDGIYYYYLAVQLYNRCGRGSVNTGPLLGSSELWQLAPDTRFAFAMDLVKRIKHWMSNNQEKTGRLLDLGSMGNIDDNYGIADLNLDMSLLFTRIAPRRN